MIPSQLISIKPVSNKETYNPELNEGDLLITKEALSDTELIEFAGVGTLESWNSCSIWCLH